MKTPPIQRALSLAGYLLVGFIALGSLLSAINNAVHIINPFLTYTGTIFVTLLWLIVALRLRRKPVEWVVARGQRIRLQKLGMKPQLALVGIILLLWVPRLGDAIRRSYGSPLPENVKTNRNSEQSGTSTIINIAIADFEGPNPDQYGVAQILYERLEDGTAKYSDIQIQRVSQSFQDSGTAKAKANEVGANMILWGSYIANSQSARVTVHLEVLKDILYLPLQQQKETFTVATTELKSFTVQEQLSSNMGRTVLLALGLIHLEQQYFDGAITTFSDALGQRAFNDRIFLPKQIFFFRGIAYFFNRKYELAIDDYTKYLEDNPDHVALANRGYCYLVEGKSDMALLDFNRAISLAPQYAPSVPRSSASVYPKK